jgi:hypothetical protein
MDGMQKKGLRKSYYKILREWLCRSDCWHHARKDDVDSALISSEEAPWYALLSIQSCMLRDVS